MKLLNVQNQVLTGPETARMLGISVSSVRNWVRHGFISTAAVNGDFIFLRDDVLSLKRRIEEGEISRLSSRANKAGSSRTFLPDELFLDDRCRDRVEALSEYIKSSSMDVGTAMFVLSLKLLEKKGLLKRHNPEAILFEGLAGIRGRNNLAEIINSWRDSALPHCSDKRASELLNFDIPDQSNILGIIYQSILQEGEKSKQGSYYTPHRVVEDIVQRMGGDDILFLDPCCGTGQFLLSFADRSGDPRRIFGIDIDSVAVNIARINMVINFPETDFEPQVFCNDSLLNYNGSQLFDNLSSLPQFDVIATNPPWGFHYEADEKKSLNYFYPDINSGESFSFFLVKSMSMLRDGGRLSFVLPESALNVKMHRDVREFILDQACISRIEYGKRIFKNVFTSAVIMDICKSGERGSLQIVKGEEEYSIDQKRFAGNKDSVFDIHLSSRDGEIIDRVWSRQHLTLKGNALWALGIVTGNNAAFITEGEPCKGEEPVARGRDIMPFAVGPVSSYISFRPEKFQQCASEEMFRAPEKLIYRYISNRPVFYCDRSGLLTLNSANIVIPKLDGVPLNYIAALFNSSLYRFIFQKKFSSVKVLRSHLEQLPVITAENDVMERIARDAEKLAAEEPGLYDEGVKSLDHDIFELFGFSSREREYILSCCG